MGCSPFPLADAAILFTGHRPSHPHSFSSTASPRMLDLEAIGLQPVLAGPDGPPLDEEESVLHKFERLQLVIGATMDQGEGTLFITEG